MMDFEPYKPEIKPTLSRGGYFDSDTRTVSSELGSVANDNGNKTLSERRD